VSETTPKKRGRESGRKAERVDYSGHELFVGLDVAKKNWKACVRTKELVLRSVTVPGRADALLRFLSKEFPGAFIQLVYEAGCFGFWIHDALVSAGIEVVIVAPHQLPKDLVKTDRLDAAKLAKFLASGLLRGIWVPSFQQRLDRSLVRRRGQLVKARGRLQDQIKKLLLFHGIGIESPVERWTIDYANSLRELELGDTLFESSLHAMLDEHADLSSRIRQQERHIRELSGRDAYAHQLALLRTIPGIGLLTGMVLLTELGEVSRFSSCERFVSYLGLSPQQSSTADRDRKGHITRAGNQFIRHALVELAWRAIRKDPALLTSYEQIRNRRGGKIAIVAVARKIALRIRRVLLNNRPYEVGRAA
jgi:transposase